MYHRQSKILKVIIAEDEPPMLRFLRKLLSRTDGFEVIAECVSGEEAIQLLSEKRVDLLSPTSACPESAVWNWRQRRGKYLRI